MGNLPVMVVDMMLYEYMGSGQLRTLPLTATTQITTQYYWLFVYEFWLKKNNRRLMKIKKKTKSKRACQAICLLPSSPHLEVLARLAYLQSNSHLFELRINLEVPQLCNPFGSLGVNFAVFDILESFKNNLFSRLWGSKSLMLWGLKFIIFFLYNLINKAINMLRLKTFLTDLHK